MKFLTILLVDDSIADTVLIEDALKDAELIETLHSVSNGELALKYLRKDHPFAEVETPDLILLDINMPVMDGHETLRQIKCDERIRHIPVIMLTTSSQRDDILRAYQQYTSSYIVKPNDFPELEKMVESVREYWNCTVKLPA